MIKCENSLIIVNFRMHFLGTNYDKQTHNKKKKDTSRFSNAKFHKLITIHKRSHWFDKKKRWKKIKQT